MPVDLFPNLIFKHSVNKSMHPCLHVFDVYSKSGGKQIGTLVCHKSEIPLRPKYNGSVLAIDFLEVNCKNQGFGKRILDFARQYSQELGCKGYMILKADNSFTPQNIPHLFYRKFGFSTFDKKTDKKLDYFIKHNKIATAEDFSSIIMHYTSQKELRKNKIYQLLLKLKIKFKL